MGWYNSMPNPKLFSLGEAQPKHQVKEDTVVNESPWGWKVVGCIYMLMAAFPVAH